MNQTCNEGDVIHFFLDNRWHGTGIIQSLKGNTQYVVKLITACKEFKKGQEIIVDEVHDVVTLL